MVQEMLGMVFSAITQTFESLLSNLVTAAFILLIGFIIAKILSKLVYNALKETKLSALLKETVGIRFSIEEIVSHFVLYFVYFISFIMTLKEIGIATDILNIIAVVIITFIAIFLVLSLKDFIPNIISGIIIQQRSLVKKGEQITVSGVTGEVIEQTLLNTKLLTKNKDIIIFPNSLLTKTQIVKSHKQKKSKK